MAQPEQPPQRVSVQRAITWEMYERAAIDVVHEEIKRMAAELRAADTEPALITIWLENWPRSA
jgi:hypothetical protein